MQDDKLSNILLRAQLMFAKKNSFPALEQYRKDLAVALNYAVVKNLKTKSE